jgi:endonuclease III
MGKEYFHNQTNQKTVLVDNPTINNFITDIEQTPHAFVLGCLMDRQIKAEKAWAIPYRIQEIVGTFDIKSLANISLARYKEIFTENKLHRFNEKMAEVFFDAVQDINSKYAGDVSLIWRDSPSSAKVVYDFLQFSGGGIKIATMATNILAREFKIPFSDYCSIDISPDVHVLRVMRRSGLVRESADIDSIIYKARELNPEFPGIIDLSCWEIGRNWCKPNKPNCKQCSIESVCKYGSKPVDDNNERIADSERMSENDLIFKGGVEGGVIALYRIQVSSGKARYIAISDSMGLDENDDEFWQQLKFDFDFDWEKAWGYLEEQNVFMLYPILIHSDYIYLFRKHFEDSQESILLQNPHWTEHIGNKWKEMLGT